MAAESIPYEEILENVILIAVGAIRDGDIEHAKKVLLNWEKKIRNKQRERGK